MVPLHCKDGLNFAEAGLAWRMPEIGAKIRQEVTFMTDAELLSELAKRKALIVHCSRPGKADEGTNGLFFPDDLQNAIDICAKERSFVAQSFGLAYRDLWRCRHHPQTPMFYDAKLELAATK
jgi:hypothetical protein